MRKVCYSVAMSLDGYVAGPNGEADWIIMGPEFDFMAMFARFDTVLMGRRTFEITQAQGHGESMPGIKSFVASRALKPQDYPELTILGDNLNETLTRLKREPGKDIWLFGGGSLFRILLDLGQVDQVEVGVIPVLLGSGVPLLPTRSERTSLRMVNSKTYKTGTVGLEYTVERTRK